MSEARTERPNASLNPSGQRRSGLLIDAAATIGVIFARKLEVTFECLLTPNPAAHPRKRTSRTPNSRKNAELKGASLFIGLIRARCRWSNAPLAIERCIESNRWVEFRD